MNLSDEQKNNAETPSAKHKPVRYTLRTKLVAAFAAIMLIPVIALTIIAWNQVTSLVSQLHEMLEWVTTDENIEDLASAASNMEAQFHDAINRSMRRSLLQIMVTGVAVLMTIIVSAAMLTSTITKNIRQLLAGITRFRTGDISYRIRSGATDEFGILADSFDEMAESIEKNVNEIHTARERAEAASEAKTIFLSNMSHEIRTPLNAIMGMAAIGKSSGELDKKDYALDQINNAGAHLLGIINDILDVSKIESKKFTLSPVSFSIGDVINKVKEMIGFRIEEKKQEFIITADEYIPGELFGDDQRLAQVLMNLLSNAVKFTSEGGAVSLDISLANIDKKSCILEFTVKDNGIGISPEQQKQLFEPFTQAEAGTSRRFGGTGLGLVISKNIIEMMSGTINVESELNKGTTVTFTVQLAYDIYKNLDNDNYKLPGAAYAREKPADLSGVTLLLAEDIEINREIVQAMLEPTKLNIECASNGIEAVDMFERNPGNYDIIFMDIQMPEMDGYTATEKIRACGKKNAKEVPIIAMTANVYKEDVENHMDTGMNDYIGKPVEYDMIVGMIKKYCR